MKKMELKGEHYLIYRRSRNEIILEYILFNSEVKRTPIVRLSGISAENAHTALLEIIGGRMYGLSLTYSMGGERSYSVRLDAAPIVLSYMILARRSRSRTKWRRMLEEIADGHLRSLQRWFTYFADMALELSKVMGDKAGGPLSPKALDAVSAGMKAAFEKILRDKDVVRK